MFNRFLTRSRIQPSGLNQTKLRPRLEILEDRLALAVRTWDGGALSNNWSNASNWVGNIAPVSGDDLVFPAGNFDKTADNDYAHGTHFRSITLGGGYTLKGNRVFLGVGGVIDNSGASNFIKNDLDLGASGGSRNFQVGSGSTLFLDGVLQGSNGFNKLGTGNLSLRSNNDYTGITAIQAGALFIEKDESLGQGLAGTNIFTGATLVVNDQALGVLRVDESLFFQAGTTLRALNDVELQGNIELHGNITVRQESALGIDSLRLNGLISGAGGMTILSGSRLRMEGTQGNSYQGTTRVFGTMLLDRDGPATFGPLVIEPGGEVETFNGEQLSNTADVTVNAGALLKLNTHGETIHSLTINGGIVFGLEDNFFPFVFDYLTAQYGVANLNILGQFTATSTSSSQSAVMNGVELAFQGTAPNLHVINGPAFEDLLIVNTLLPNVAHKTGSGVLHDRSDFPLINVIEADLDVDNQLFIDEGLVRFENRQRFTEVIVNSGGRFAGGSDIKSLTVNAGGRVRPGLLSSTGVLTIKNNLTLQPGAIVEAVFNGSNAGSQHDQMDVEGTVDVDGAILEATLGANTVIGQTYKLINNNAGDSILGAFFLPPLNSPFLIANPTGQRLAFNYNGGTLNNDLVLTLSNTPPKAPDLALNTTDINEGGTVTATGRLVDPDTKDKLRLFVSWGDGTRQELHRPGRDLFSLTHRYRNNGVYTARFEWLDQNNQGNSRDFTITVNNVPPTLTLRTFRTFSSGVLLASGWIGDSGNDLYNTTIDYGDGSPIRSNTLQRRNNLALAHRYQNAGTYTVTITLRDALGVESVFQRQVRID